MSRFAVLIRYIVRITMLWGHFFVVYTKKIEKLDKVQFFLYNQIVKFPKAEI